MKRALHLLAVGSLLLIGCSSESASSSSAEGTKGFFGKISKAYKDGAKHRTTTFKADKKTKSECVEVEYEKGDDGKKSLFKLTIKKRSEESANTSSLNYYHNQTQSAEGLKPCDN